MKDIEFKNGFLCGLLATGLGITGDSSSSSDSALLLVDTLDITNLAYYKNVITYLNATNYTPLVSSTFSYMPKEGYVIIGGFDLYDFESDSWWLSAEADIKITVDGTVIYEGDSGEFFDYEVSFVTPKTFKYKTDFEFSARRRNMSDGMQMQLKETMIVGLK